MISTVIQLECIQRLSHHQIAERLWLTSDKYHSGALNLLVSPAPGGAFSSFGFLEVRDYYVYVKLKTVWGIIRHRDRREEFCFEFCDPQFPDNLYRFVDRAAGNAQRCFSLAHNRMWRRVNRDTRSRVGERRLLGV